MGIDQQSLWEHRQAELWDRVFQSTADVVALVESMEGTATKRQVWHELVRSATRVGSELVRANAANNGRQFAAHIAEARLNAIETDYWLRLVHVLQQDDDVQRDLSSLITQYSSIISLLQQFFKDARSHPRSAARRISGRKVSL